MAGWPGMAMLLSRGSQAGEYALTDMKKTTTLIFIISFISLAYAQDPGKHNISLGAGFPNLLNSLLKIYANEQDYAHTGRGPFHAKYEYRIGNHVGLGLNINYVSTRIKYIRTFVDDNGRSFLNHITINNTNAALNFRTNFHFLNTETHPKTDFYFGIGIGYRLGGFKVSADYSDGAPSIRLPSLWHLGLESTVGYRYFFNDYAGLYAELGLAQSIIQGGIVGRF